MLPRFPRPATPYESVSRQIYGGDPFRKQVTDTPLGLKQNKSSIDTNNFLIPIPVTGIKTKFDFDYGELFSNLKRSGQTELERSPEAQRAINFLQSQIGKKINLYPLSSADLQQSPDMLGGFRPSSMDQPRFKKEVDIELNTDKAGYETLFHEVGHARDPYLRQASRKESGFNPAFINSLNSPSERLKYFSDTNIKPRVESETEAQAYSAFQLPRFARENPDINIPYQKTFDDPWFKEYPASYASKGIDKFYKTELYGGDRPAPFDENSPAAVRFISPVDSGQKALSFGLDTSLQKTEKDILGRTRSFIDARLNPYQTSPTPAAPDYWTPKR